MSRYQTIRRPPGPIDHDVIAQLLRDLGEPVPKRVARPHSRQWRWVPRPMNPLTPAAYQAALRALLRERLQEIAAKRESPLRDWALKAADDPDMLPAPVDLSDAAIVAALVRTFQPEPTETDQ